MSHASEHQNNAGTDRDAATLVRNAGSLLFVPGNRPERFAKATATAADLVICDLEDAVAAGAKDGARSEVVSWLAGPGRAAVRINATDSPAHETDMAALAGTTSQASHGLLSVMVPKAEDPERLSAIAARLGVPVIALIETALGMHQATQVAAADGVVRLAFGHLDYAVDVGAGASRPAMQHARSGLVLASRVAGLDGPVDGVTTVLDDPSAAADDAAYAQDLGFTGKLLIHPTQVDPVNAALRPSDEEMAWAERVLNAADEPGAVSVDGEMVDQPVIERARRIRHRTRKHPAREE